MELLTIELNNITIKTPEHPNECLFMSFQSENGETVLSPELFEDFDAGKEALSQLVSFHIFKTHDAPEFGEEAFIDVDNGLRLCIGADYVRFVDSESLVESMYWHVDEIVEDFQSVFGAIGGATCSGVML